MVEQARVIREQINAAYRRVPGRKLVVTEATSTDVVETLIYAVPYAGR